MYVVIGVLIATVVLSGVVIFMLIRLITHLKRNRVAAEDDVSYPRETESQEMSRPAPQYREPRRDHSIRSVEGIPIETGVLPGARAAADVSTTPQHPLGRPSDRTFFSGETPPPQVPMVGNASPHFYDVVKDGHPSEGAS